MMLPAVSTRRFEEITKTRPFGTHWPNAFVLVAVLFVCVSVPYTVTCKAFRIAFVVQNLGSWTESVGSRVTSRGGGWPSNARVDGVGFGGRDQPRSIPSG